jgi:integrase
VAAARSHLGNRNAATLNEADCNAYTAARRARGRSDSTIWTELGRLRSALRWAENSTLPHVKLFAVLAATTGARMGAILSLTWDRVDFERGLIRYADPAVTATRKGRATTPINALARKALTEAQKGATAPSLSNGQDSASGP